MGLSTLLLDVGNTRVKWRLLVDDVVSEGAVDHRGDVPQMVASLPRMAVARVALAQVLGAKPGEALVKALAARYRCLPQQAVVKSGVLGVTVAYRQPQRLGVDRWLAMLAARRLGPGQPSVVAMAGTALTLDVVTAEGRHLGGLIAPGLTSAARATLRDTRFDCAALPVPAPGALGRDTEICVALGARLACLGALDRGAAMAPPGSVRWLGGGDAPALLPMLPGWQPLRQPVLDGLQVWGEAVAFAPPTD